jgi:hypothetical protein
MWRSLFVLCLALAIPGERAAWAQLQMTKQTTPYAGVVHQVWTDPSVPLKLHLVQIDITSQEIHLSATQSSERGHTTTDWANCVGGASGCAPVDVAINGDLFTPLGFVPQGFAMGGAKAWTDAAKDNATEGYFAFGRPGDQNAVFLSPPPNVEQPPMSLAASGAVSGRTLLVSGAQAMTVYDPADPTEPFRFAPRTAVALDDTKHTLYLVVVDGDQAASVGMTAEELADFLVAQGANDALELDGGGSSTLFIRGEKGVVNAPSDGVERTVANQLGVRYGLSPYRFSVVGLIYDTTFGDMNKLITNAAVTVDGQVATWQNSHTLYHVDNIAPHFVCAHASAPTFRSATQCRQITESDVAPPSGNSIQYLSMVLYKCPGGATSCDPPPDMSVPPDMAHQTGPSDFALVHDLGASDDAGPGSAEGGCSMVPHETVPSFTWLLVVVCLGAAGNPRRARK